MSEGDYLKNALFYASLGWRVFPLSPGQKVPRRSSRGFLDATTDVDIIRAWWQHEPRYNVGIATGAASGLFVVDVDPRHGGSDTLAALQQKHGKLPPTVIVSTGGGGFQFYFRHEEGLGSGAGRIGQGIDHRGEGGYVVAPPSLHPSGGIYRFFEGSAPGELPLAELPEWVLELLFTADSFKGNLSNDYYRDLFAKGATEGARNESLVRMAGHLIRKRLDPFLVLDILRLWNAHRFNPPGDEKKLEDIVNRVAGRELQRITKRRPHQ